MIVVDTSVWIDFFRGATTPTVERFVAMVDDDEGIAITDVILTEILHGLRSEADVRRVECRLAPFEVLRLEDLADFRRAAALYRGARSQGITIRRTLDCLIASVCIREDVALFTPTPTSTPRVLQCPSAGVTSPPTKPAHSRLWMLRRGRPQPRSCVPVSGRGRRKRPKHRRRS